MFSKEYDGLFLSVFFGVCKISNGMGEFVLFTYSRF